MTGDWKAFEMEFTPPKSAETITVNTAETNTLNVVVQGSRAESTNSKDES